jgi:DNA polymerase-3 subunit epsilon
MNLATLLRLERPIAVIDLESTGVLVTMDRIVQIALTIHYPHREPIPWVQLINPGLPILNAAIHRITDERVAEAPFFKQVAPALAPKLTNLDFAGYNVTFDLKLLRAEMQRAGVAWEWETPDIKVIDAQRIYQIKSPRTLSAAYDEYCGGDLEGAHDAGVDVRATEAVLAGQLTRHADLPRTVKELGDLCYPPSKDGLDRAGKLVWRGGEACIGFGKHAGKPLKTVEKNYLEWILKNEFPADLTAIVEAALRGTFPTSEM